MRKAQAGGELAVKGFRVGDHDRQEVIVEVTVAPAEDVPGDPARPTPDRQRPQQHDRVQGGLVVAHDHARAGPPEVLQATGPYPRPCGAQPYPSPHTIRSVSAESARAVPRHHTSMATATVASAPASNVGTVRQDARGRSWRA
jgi:hypothetical protein